MKRHLTIRSLAALGLILAAAWSGVPAWAAEPAKVMTYNIRFANKNDGQDVWANRVETVAETLRQADTAGLQEALLTQVEDLAERLPEFEWFGAGRDDGNRAGEMVPIFYRKDRFERVDGGHFWLSETPEKAGSVGWDARLPRLATWVVLQDRKTQEKLLHVNTHFDHMGVEARRQSAMLLRERLARLAPDLPLVLTGDFNFSPDAAPYQILTDENGAGQGFIDTLAGYKPAEGQPAGTWNGFKTIEPRRIDFILTARGAEAGDTKILDPRTPEGRFGSDHLPIISGINYSS